MPILGMQQRLVEVGRIRTGVRKTTATGKSYPAKLETFRFTSVSKSQIECVAAIYGGQVKPWSNDGQAEWEVLTPVSEIQVYASPQECTQWYEMWSGGGCVRRCDGQRCSFAENGALREVPCKCSDEDRGTPVGCKATTRASFILPQIEGIGVWRLESHGWNAAQELPMAYNMLRQQAMQGRYVPAILALRPEERRTPGGETMKFVVPMLTPMQTAYDVLNPGSVGEIAPAPVAQIQGARTALPPAQPAAPKTRQIEPAKPAAGIWSGPGQCPGCHAPEGKRHGAKCTAPVVEPEPELNPGSTYAQPCEVCGHTNGHADGCPEAPDYAPTLDGALLDVPPTKSNMGGAHV